MPSSFPDHLALLTDFLDRHRAIVETIETRVLSAPASAAPGPALRHQYTERLNSCFFPPAMPERSRRLKGALAAAHRADGFEPAQLDNYSTELDPAELAWKAHRHWAASRRPGRSGRLSFAETVYAVFMIRQLEHLSLRIWDDDEAGAGGRLCALQELLDRLNAAVGPRALVRDIRWLMQTAQGPLTRHLMPYFRVAEHIARSLVIDQRLEIHSADAKLAGGHMRSQLHYRVWDTGRPPDDPELTAFMRHTNSMDTALLIGDLVPLLEAYRAACAGDDRDARLALADAILQGLSADPELCLTRLDLLGPCTTIESLFVEGGEDGWPRRSRMGEAHLRVLAQYARLIGEAAAALSEDAATYDPSEAPYSPYGITYGFCADLMSNIATSALMAPPSGDVSLEDVFASRGRLQEKLARAQAWAALPTRPGERAHFDHSTEWAQRMFERLTRALIARARCPARPNASDVPNARLFVQASGDSPGSRPADPLPPGLTAAPEYCETSDVRRTLAAEAMLRPKSQMLDDRNEGRFLASAEIAGAWFGIPKLLLTLEIGQGKDVLLTGVPAPVIDILRLTAASVVNVR